MDIYAEKISLLSEMIAFALVDNELHDSEYDFLLLIANDLQIEKETFLDLFKKRNGFLVVKNEFQRILHFYKLSLLMFADGNLHHKEDVLIHQIGIQMGLNPFAMNRIIKLMKNAPDTMIAPEVFVGIFEEQYN